MKVISNKTIDFPSLKWSIEKGKVKELPENKDDAKKILANRHIQEQKQEETKIKK